MKAANTAKMYQARACRPYWHMNIEYCDKACLHKFSVNALQSKWGYRNGRWSRDLDACDADMCDGLVESTKSKVCVKCEQLGIQSIQPAIEWLQNNSEEI